ncbi:MAG: hypothetical protein AAF639_10100 [Chloroflexota bacterium]
MSIIVRILITCITLTLQLLIGQLLGFGGAMALGVGDGVELFVIPIGNVIGVWGVGALAELLQRTFDKQSSLVRFISTAIGGAAGVGLILITPATGLAQVLYSLLLALLGYYIAPVLLKQ